MKKNDLNLPEWAFLDADNHTGNALSGRDVLLHVRTHTIFEFINLDDVQVKLNDSVKQKQFKFNNSLGLSESYVVAIHYSLAEFANLDDVTDKAIQFFINWMNWMDGNIAEKNTSKFN